jgi:signal transduction histidine kinase
MRPTGIDVIGDVPWGTHFCQFYQSKQDLLDTLVPYFKAGLLGNEFCMWVTSEPLGAEEARAALRRALPDFDDYVHRGQLEILPYHQWYTKTGRFDADRVLAGWAEKEAAALERGFEGLRLTGNTFWLEKKDWKEFTDYEAAVNEVIGRHRMIAMCTYSVERCSAFEVMDVVSNHEFVLIRHDADWQLIESSNLKQAKESLRRTADELARSNQELQQFTSMVAHDLKAPLRTVTGYLQLLERRYKSRLDAEADEFIRFAVEGAGRMTRLIDDLLAYSRVTTQAGPPEPTDCAEVLEQALANLQTPIRESGATIVHDLLPGVQADPTQLVQLFQNLIGNAIKFRGSGPPRIRITVRRVNGAWQFSVSDNGIGIEAQYFERVFEMFERLHGDDEYPGTGIGLAICKKIVERHGGRIWVESEPGKGSTFHFTLGGAPKGKGGCDA